MWLIWLWRIVWSLCRLNVASLKLHAKCLMKCLRGIWLLGMLWLLDTRKTGMLGVFWRFIVRWSWVGRVLMLLPFWGSVGLCKSWSTRNWSWGEREIERLGFGSNPILSNALVNRYSRCGNSGAEVLLLLGGEERGFVDGNHWWVWNPWPWGDGDRAFWWVG